MGSLQRRAGTGLIAVTVAVVVLASMDLIGGQDDYARYWGMCDASAGVALDKDRFIVADDETNQFFIYRQGQGRPPLQRVKWDSSDPGGDRPTDSETEGDVEGAAQIGDYIFWITSHGRSRSGELRRSRHQFFAVRVAKRGEQYVFSKVGRTYRDLAQQMAENPQLQGIGLAESLQLHAKKSGKLAPKREGFNIEGLAAAPDGSLLIGLRNPRPQGKAVVIRLLNPLEVLTEQATPQFDPPILLDFGRSPERPRQNLGIRDLVYSSRRGDFLVIAGPHDGAGAFAMFSWSGQPHDAPQRLEGLTSTLAQAKGFAPEALLLSADGTDLQMLSDDGSLKIAVSSPEDCKPGTFDKGYCQTKDLRDDRLKSFRSVTVSVP